MQGRSSGIKGTRLSLPILLHTKRGIEKTLAFIKETGIATRRWHLERRTRDIEAMKEEGEEGVEEVGDEEEDGG